MHGYIITSYYQHSFYSFPLITCLVYFKVNICFKNDTPALAEDKETEMLVIVSITLKRGRSGKMAKWGRNKVFDLVQSFLDSDITHKTFDELLQSIIEVNAVKWRTIGESQCLSLPKEEPKYLAMATNI